MKNFNDEVKTIARKVDMQSVFTRSKFTEIETKYLEFVSIVKYRELEAAIEERVPLSKFFLLEKTLLNYLKKNEFNDHKKQQ